MQDILLAIDVGTTLVKAAAYDQGGTMIAKHSSACTLKRTQSTWSEQDMEEVWQTVCTCLRHLSANIDTNRVKSLGLCAQGDGLWMLGPDGRPNGPAMLWNDTRAAELVSGKGSEARNRAVAKACHTANWPGTAASLFAWLLQNDTSRAKNCATIICCADWIGVKLTGVLATDYSDASIPFMDISAKVWSAETLKAFGLDLTPMPPVQRADTRLGALVPSAAQATGLPPGLPVATGTLDLGAMMVGLGLHKPGTAMMVLGTTAVVNILTRQIDPSDTPVGATVLHPTADLFIRVLAPTSGAQVFNWFAGLHPRSLSGDSTEKIADKLNSLAKEVAPGANGVFFLPYLNGERAPFVAPQARGAFHGLTAQTTMAGMGRAVMEGTAFSLRHCFHAQGGLPARPVWLTGGGAKNHLWCKIIADVIGVPVIVSKNSDHGLWGAACIGAAAAGTPCIGAARKEQRHEYLPDPENHQKYNQAYARYEALVAASKAIWEVLK